MRSCLLDLIKKSSESVEKRNPFVYYEVDGYKIDNTHLAKWYEKEFGTTAKFVYRDFSDLKKQLQTTKIDLEHDYNSDFLKFLRSNYDHVHLLFSGGADSLTILEKAYFDQIKLDETITLVIEDIELPCNREYKNLALPKLEKYKQTISKTTILEYSFDSVADYFKDPYTFFSITTDPIIPVNFSIAVRDALKNYNNIENSCLIKGSDKPTLMFYNSKWYSVLVDASLDGDQMIPNIIYFWLDIKNIKSLLKDSICYKNYIVDNNLHKKTDETQFFKVGKSSLENSIINRSCVDDWETQFEKDNNKKNSKLKKRIIDAVNGNHNKLLANYYTACNTFYKIFPDALTLEGQNQYNTGKFAWIIDLETFDVYTQEEFF